MLKSSEWFAALEPAFQQAVLVSSRVRVLAAGRAIFRRGDPNDGLYCILSGAVRFGAVAPSGKESMVALIEAPEWFGEIALFDGGVRTHDAWADVTSSIKTNWSSVRRRARDSINSRQWTVLLRRLRRQCRTGGPPSRERPMTIC